MTQRFSESVVAPKVIGFFRAPLHTSGTLPRSYEQRDPTGLTGTAPSVGWNAAAATKRFARAHARVR